MPDCHPTPTTYCLLDIPPPPTIHALCYIQGNDPSSCLYDISVGYLQVLNTLCGTLSTLTFSAVCLLRLNSAVFTHASFSYIISPYSSPRLPWKPNIYPQHWPSSGLSIIRIIIWYTADNKLWSNTRTPLCLSSTMCSKMSPQKMGWNCWVYDENQPC